MGAKVIISNLHPNVSQGDIKVSSLILKASDVIRFCSEIASLQWRPSSITSFMEHFEGIGKIWYKLNIFGVILETSGSSYLNFLNISYLS